MLGSIRTFLVPILLVVIPTLIAFAWGLSWARGDFPECGEGTYFLADSGWLALGLLLGLIVGVAVPIILAVRRSFLLAIPVVVAAGIGMLLAGDAGATIAPPLVGCSAWDTRDAETIIVLGLVIGAVPTILVAGIIIGIRALLRHGLSSSRDDAGSPTDPAD